VRIVLDTNVLVAGLLSPFGPCGEIVRLVSSEELTLCFDARILTEYREVLARPKFRFDPDRVTVLLDQIKQAGETVAPSPLRQRLPDPADEPFLAVAVSAGVEALVTGNLSHFPPAVRQETRVTAPSDFLEWYRSTRGPSP
jgi:uncharacterized protein